MLAYAFRKSAMIDVRHHQAAQHEKHVDGKITLADEVALRRYVEIGKVLGGSAIMIEYHPKRGDTAQWRQRRKLTIGRVPNAA